MTFDILGYNSFDVEKASLRLVLASYYQNVFVNEYAKK